MKKYLIAALIFLASCTKQEILDATTEPSPTAPSITVYIDGVAYWYTGDEIQASYVPDHGWNHLMCRKGSDSVFNMGFRATVLADSLYVLMPQDAFFTFKEGTVTYDGPLSYREAMRLVAVHIEKVENGKVSGYFDSNLRNIATKKVCSLYGTFRNIEFRK